jgi:hypothetical protein
MTRRFSLWLYGLLTALSLWLIFWVTRWGRVLTCRIRHEHDTDTGYRSHQAIRDECTERQDIFLLFRR